MKEMKVKKEKGITLVALVVTIVVLLILAGVSLNLVIGNNGLIKKAQEAKDKYQEASINTEKGFAEMYDELQTNLGEFPSTEYTKPYLPTGFTRVEGTGLSNGLVIQDGNGNQYVWVEVPKTETVYSTAGLAITSFTDEEYTKIENDLHTYTSKYRKDTRYKDAYEYDASGGWFKSAIEYNEAKKKMLKSVYQNGGFYVGRYETGIATTASGSTTQTPVIKANALPYRNVTRTGAKWLAGNMAHGDKTTSLMFGVQWDLMLAYMHHAGRIDESVLTSDSKTIGNYKNNLWNITNGSAKWSGNNGTTWENCPKGKEGSEASILLTTGADTSFGIMNIYDVAGGLWEWTLERTGVGTYTCTLRGGSFNVDGSAAPASARKDYGPYGSDPSFGFRVTLY